ncbi:hypothetical protein LAZ67_7003053 [Cordylochernes scorpioides]|uniref:SCP domain-containing protein n=1 Tax=Cordylochernes scorpioides TaxID=51811 RepID=A0ABY6KTN9_9ARAC|nr:hypothetical protein LAZ67_7003053 [Cordylochernes scorpioides]
MVMVEQAVLGRRPVVRHQDEEGRPEYHQSEFVLNALHWHNLLRDKHGVPPLTLSYQLCSLAQYWANHLAHTNTFYHRNYRDIGENLFLKDTFGSDVTGEQVTKYWYNEIKWYNFYQDPALLHVKAGHFTQLVWRNTTEFGVGKARTRCGKLIIVATYKPVGNVAGEFVENVLPPLSDLDLGEDN